MTYEEINKLRQEDGCEYVSRAIEEIRRELFEELKKISYKEILRAIGMEAILDSMEYVYDIKSFLDCCNGFYCTFQEGEIFYVYDGDQYLVRSNMYRLKGLNRDFPEIEEFNVGKDYDRVEVWINEGIHGVDLQQDEDYDEYSEDDFTDNFKNFLKKKYGDDNVSFCGRFVTITYD